MWAGVIPAVTTRFKEDGTRDHAGNERCITLQRGAGCDGPIVGGSLGEGPMLRLEEKVAPLERAKSVSGSQPAITTVAAVEAIIAAALATRLSLPALRKEHRR